MHLITVHRCPLHLWLQGHFLDMALLAGKSNRRLGMELPWGHRWHGLANFLLYTCRVAHRRGLQPAAY